MKNALFVLSIFFVFGCSQKTVDIPQVNKIDVLKSSVENNGIASDEEIVVRSSIKNLTNDLVEVKWKRIVKNVPKGWEMAVCDTNACYFPQIDSATFDLPPNRSTRLWAYFYPGDSIGQGTAQIQVYAVSQPQKRFVISYKASATK